MSGLVDRVMGNIEQQLRALPTKVAKYTKERQKHRKKQLLMDGPELTKIRKFEASRWKQSSDFHYSVQSN